MNRTIYDQESKDRNDPAKPAWLGESHRRSGSPMIQIDRALAEKLAENIRQLTHHWHPNPNDSDYCCEFCGKTANTNQGDITHSKDCDGMEMLQKLNQALEAADEEEICPDSH